ncbi:hypothetical protein TNCV_722141 [Trichonephila clavipes]|nr:hypothetical protein TNCV_722141 [Trichonephila clavipes]
MPAMIRYFDHQATAAATISPNEKTLTIENMSPNLVLIILTAFEANSGKISTICCISFHLATSYYRPKLVDCLIRKYGDPVSGNAITHVGAPLALVSRINDTVVATSLFLDPGRQIISSHDKSVKATSCQYGDKASLQWGMME